MTEWVLENSGKDFEIWKLRVNEPAGWFVKFVKVFYLDWEKGPPGPDCETDRFEMDPVFVPDSKQMGAG